MTTIAVVYHSGFGHTEVQAKHVFEGALSVDGVSAILIKAEDARKELELLDKVDAIIFGSPTYLGNVSASFKRFMDETSQIWFHQKWKNKIAAGFTNSTSLSGDKLTTLISLTIFAAQHGMIWVGQSEMNTSPPGESGHIHAVNRTGTMLGAVAQSDDASPEVTPTAGDLQTAKMLGRRVAEIAHQFQAAA
ncbi:flavodoxin family protein [Curvivirga sp.]|uniref:flavodoxin family protein n=1 Tax=Curvivirga sp. TaxID=2856848 RepID=UPI003B5C291F